MTHKPTEEQAAIIAAAQADRTNLIINARAGAAKTSTLVMIAEALSQDEILCLAFNKAIAEEMKTRLPFNCDARTLNGLGHRAWLRFINRRAIVDTSKTYKIVNGLMEGLRKSEKEEVYGNLSDIIKAVDSSKHMGFLPAGVFPHAKPLIGNEEDFFDGLEENFSLLEEQIIVKAIIRSFEMALEGHIDFNDQILCPAVYPVKFDPVETVMVDEAQDLSPINHVLIKKLVGKNRLIAVGDPCQAIYGFRGADSGSMEKLKSTFQMAEFTLTISFRCGQSIIREAHWRAPDMRWPEWAVEGSVRNFDRWTPETFATDDAIICRNNAPIFRTALQLLKAGRYPKIFGNDIGQGLIKIMRKFGHDDLPQAQVFLAIEEWKEVQAKKKKNPATLSDKAECMTIFASEAPDLGGAIAYANSIFKSEGPIKMMTGHKSKGLEFNRVFILDKFLIRDGRNGSPLSPQDNNLLYVMQTRAKEELIYIETAGFIAA